MRPAPRLAALASVVFLTSPALPSAATPICPARGEPRSQGIAVPDPERHRVHASASPDGGSVTAQATGDGGWLYGYGSGRGAELSGARRDGSIGGTARVASDGAHLCLTTAGGPRLPTAGWPMYTGDVRGSRANPAERTLSPTTVTRGLAEAWRFRAPNGPVYGTPAVAGGTVYAADGGGVVMALDAETGNPRWLSHVTGALVTSSVLVTPKLVVVGDHSGTVHGLRRTTGSVAWRVRPNPHGYPAIWGSPVAANVSMEGRRRDVILVPVASNEEIVTVTEAQPCCSSRGSLVALDPATGDVLWQSYMVDDAAAASGASGATIWSTPVYDAESNRVLVTTGNNYGNRDGTPTTTTSDAIVAIDAATGSIVWVNQRTPNDTWVMRYPISPAHPDADFGDSPALGRLRDGTPVVIAGQKSGVLHVVRLADGALVAHRQFVPGGGLGGFFADAAFDGSTLFANANDWPNYGGGEIGGFAGFVQHPLGLSDPPVGNVIAVRVGADGTLSESWRHSTPGSPALGAVAIANGVVYFHASGDGRLVALDASTGAVLASALVGPAVSGPSVADGRVFVAYGDGLGYADVNPAVGGIVAFTAT